MLPSGALDDQHNEARASSFVQPGLLGKKAASARALPAGCALCEKLPRTNRLRNEGRNELARSGGCTSKTAWQGQHLRDLPSSDPLIHMLRAPDINKSAASNVRPAMAIDSPIYLLLPSERSFDVMPFCLPHLVLVVLGR